MQGEQFLAEDERGKHLVNLVAEKNKPSASTQSRARILIVEDERLVAEDIKEVLENAGHQVAGIFSTGEAVLKNLNKARPDLIIMDVRLKGALDGIQTAIAIHESIEEIPIIFVTAHPESEYPELISLKPSSFGYVTKPFQNERLLSSIKKLLGLTSK